MRVDRTFGADHTTMFTVDYEIGGSAQQHDHPFEAWFASSEDYDGQAERGLVECPFCGSRQVRKQIMAPAVAPTISPAT